MGLDMYFVGNKTLSAYKKKEKLYIDYFNTLNEPDMDTEEGLFISQYWGNGAVMTQVLKSLPKLDGQMGDVSTVRKINGEYVISTEVMYWRKANQIHDWFVKYVQDGIDDCTRYTVEKHHLIDLQERISFILAGIKFPASKQMYNEKNKWEAPQSNLWLAQKLLPCSNGFFFGNTDYNKWYFDDLRNTKKFLRSVLKKSTQANWTFEYHSSW